MIDLRSDTVTRPSPGMKEAMLSAEVGDDVFGDDPTVIALEARLADMFGHEAALFVPSGTMGNQVSLYTHGRRGDELLVDADAHIVHYEVGAAAALTGLQLCPIPSANGILDPDEVRARVRTANIHHPITRIVALENTHNRAGGTVYPLETTRALITVARDANMLIHLDGARIWNAHIASGITLPELARGFDSVSVCFSKGLGCPVGSAVIGSSEFITRARRTRKMFGGGMRQVGILAAAVDWALDNNLARIADDHRHAREFAASLRELSGLRFVPDPPPTNIVVMDLADSGISPELVLDTCAEAGLTLVPFGGSRLRAVFHADIDDTRARQAAGIFSQVYQSL